MAGQIGGKMMFSKNWQLTSCVYPGDQKFCQNLAISHCFPRIEFFVFYAEFQDGRQKLWENDIWQKVPDDSEYTLGVKYFPEITLPRKISEINVFICFGRNSRWSSKMTGKRFLAKMGQITVYCGGQTFHQNHCISHILRFSVDFCVVSQKMAGIFFGRK